MVQLQITVFKAKVCLFFNNFSLNKELYLDVLPSCIIRLRFKDLK
jgi:hypothetical protein